MSGLRLELAHLFDTKLTSTRLAYSPYSGNCLPVATMPQQDNIADLVGGVLFHSRYMLLRSDSRFGPACDRDAGHDHTNAPCLTKQTCNPVARRVARPVDYDCKLAVAESFGIGLGK